MAESRTLASQDPKIAVGEQVQLFSQKEAERHPDLYAAILASSSPSYPEHICPVWSCCRSFFSHKALEKHLQIHVRKTKAKPDNVKALTQPQSPQDTPHVPSPSPSTTSTSLTNDTMDTQLTRVSLDKHQSYTDNPSEEMMLKLPAPITKIVSVYEAMTPLTKEADSTPFESEKKTLGMRIRKILCG
jgi:hypothetical protein